MNKKISNWMKGLLIVGMIVCSVVQIHLRMETYNMGNSAGYHWDIFALELLLIICFYVLLFLRGKESLGRSRKKRMNKNGQVKAC